jgi:hypothetical protein
MEHLVRLPQYKDTLMGPLPEVERGYVLVRVMPHNPTTVDSVRHLGKDKPKDLAKPIDEHGAVRFENTQTLSDPLFTPKQVVVHRLLITVITKVLPDIVGGIGDNNLSRVWI